MNYLILSLSHSEGNKPCFWRPDDAGFTYYPFTAGIYSEERVKGDPAYYNNGKNTLAIPLTEDGLDSIGFKTTMNKKKVLDLAAKVEKGVSA